MEKNKIATAKIVYLEDWTLEGEKINNIIEGLNGEDILILSVGKFRPNNQAIINKIYSAIQSNRCGALELQRGPEEEEVILDNFEALEGPILALSTKALRLNKFQTQYKTFKYAVADLCHRLNLDSLKCMILRLPEVTIKDIPNARSERLDSQRNNDSSTYDEIWGRALSG